MACSFINFLQAKRQWYMAWHNCLRLDRRESKTNSRKKLAIVIRQTFLRVHFTTYTDSAISISYSETFRLNKEEGIKHLAYLFIKDTSQSLSTNAQEGATELKLVESETSRTLNGKYFSNLKTNGMIEVKFISKKQVDSFKDALELSK